MPALSLAGAAIALAVVSGSARAHGVPPALSEPASLFHKVAVFGKDDRVPLPERYQNLKQSIGVLVNPKTNSICTAFCIGADIIATAAHCMFRTAGEALPRASDVIFSRDRGTTRIQSRIAGYRNNSATQNIMSGSMRLSIRPPIEATKDWAIARLAEPICRGAALEIQALDSPKLEQEARSGRVFQVAFHRDYDDWKLAYSQPCAVKRNFDAAHWKTIARDFVDPENMILHLCDTGGASSGSPILLDRAGGPVVVGINVGTYVQSKIMIQNGEVVHRAKADAVANTAVSALAFRDRVEAFTSAAILASGARMREMQALLRSRGLYAGPVDGTYGPAMKTAIEIYERGEGLSISGLASEVVLKRLLDARHDVVSPSAATAGPPAVLRSRTDTAVGAGHRLTRSH